MADHDNQGNTSEDQKTDHEYDKVIQKQPGGTSVGSGMATNRDLGTVGGGTIPTGGGVMGSGNSPGGMSTSSDTVVGGGVPGGGRIGAGAPTDRGRVTDTDITESQGNVIDPQAQGNLGGRNPSQPQTSMGDRDTKKAGEDQGGRAERGGPDITDPMTSRDPSKVSRPEG